MSSTLPQGSSFSSKSSSSLTPPASPSPPLNQSISTRSLTNIPSSASPSPLDSPPSAKSSSPQHNSHDGPSPPTGSQKSPPSPPHPRSPSSTPVRPSSSSLSSATKNQVENSKSSNASNQSSGSQSNVQFPVVLVAAAGAAVFFLMMLVCICCAKKQKKKKQKQHHDTMQYYAETKTYSDGDFYANDPDSKWHKEEHVVDVTPSPGPLHGGGWHQHSPERKSSSDMSTYSGPHSPPPPLPPPSPPIPLGLNQSTFTYEELASATNGFAPANLLGQGGFGYVHKGVLPNGKEVAVKQLKAGSGQGEREFYAEVDIISRIHHRHLVSLVGFCMAGSQRLLVYEFVPNRTLEYHLHAKGLPVMEWSRRLKIALGSARGLAYLHEDCHPRIIHRDIKSANILLDLKFEAMVADFGLAKLSLDNHTHVSTRVMGTFGYLAPEYAASGKLTEKSDVFSYGVMLLELITGKRPVDTHTFAEDSLVDWARPLLSRSLTDGDYDDLADPRLNGNYDPMEMARMVACAAASVRHSAKKRPKMSQIVRALEGGVSLEDLNEGVRPGESMLFAANSNYDPHSYTSNMNRIRKVVLTPEYSEGYTGPITEYDSRHSASDSDGFAEDPVGNQRHQ